MTSSDYPRDMVGYGRTPPDPRWPQGARIAVQFVINYEEGAENNILHGDEAAEGYMSEVSAFAPLPGRRNSSIETMYEYGSRAGFWRLFRIFTERNVPVTVYGVAMALARNLEAVAAMNEAEWEIASHGYRWIDYQTMGIEQERWHLEKAIEVHTAGDWQPAARHVHRPRDHRDATARGGGGRLSLQLGFVRRRPPLLGVEVLAAAADHPLRPRQQRHALRDRDGIHLRRGLLRLSARFVRPAVR